MKQICFVHINGYSFFSPSSSASIGGTEVQLGLLANFLRKESFKVSYITGDWGQKKEECFNGVKVIKSFSLRKTLFNFIKSPFLLWFSLRSVDGDVYIMSSASVEVGIVALFCRIYRKKFVYWTAHDLDCNKGFRKQNLIKGYLFEYGMRNADVVVAQNDLHASILKKVYNIDAIVIKNGFLIKKDTHSKKSYTLWVARCETWKNPDLFLKIATAFPRHDFVLISSKQNLDNGLFATIKNKSKSLSNLQFIENVPFSNIQQYFDNAAIFIGTSEYEGFPNTYLHSCLASVPIISYKVNPDSFITKDKVGYCADGNFEKMLDYIKILLNDENDWQEKSKNAREYVEHNHNIEIIGKKWKKLIQEL